MTLLFRFFRIFDFHPIRNIMANTLPKILSKSSIRHDLIDCIETFISAPNPEERLVMDSMTKYISVRYFDYIGPVYLA